MTRLLHISARAGLLAAASVLAGCVTLMDELEPGTPVAEIQQRYGEPTARCPLPEGAGERLIWSRQPLGQYAWGVDVAPDGKTGAVRSLLTDENFARLSSGYWPAERVRCEFGPPAEIREVGHGQARQTVWNYRYKNRGGWPSLLTVHMGPDGKTARRYESNDDPNAASNGPGSGGSE
ncbi:hypothetical protein V8Z80_19620 [Orrella sp. JC864]|uniref:hypothetical protein n=1 Tax=Orrella sp. JC864 TaxID=3120298 RepID=UPI00300B9B2D